MDLRRKLPYFIMKNSGYIDTVSGIAPLTLPKAKGNGLKSLTAFGKCEQAFVPTGYTRTLYTANNATAASKIDTGLMPQDGDVIEVHCKSGAAGVSFYCFQARAKSGAAIYGLSGSSSGGTITADWSTSIRSDITRADGHEFLIRVSFVDGVSTLYVKDLTSGTEDTQTGTYDPVNNVPISNYYLWGNNVNYLNRSYPIYEVKLTNNGVTRLHLIPCTRDSGSEVGFYDLASKSFVMSATDVLTAGSNLPTTTIPLDIICNNGTITCSRNMFRTTGTSTTAGGVVYTVQPDGSLVVSGTATAYSSWQFGRAYVTPNMGTVTLAIDGVYGNPANVTVDRCQLCNSSGTAITSLSWTTWTKSITVDLSEYPTASYINVTLKRASNGACSGTIKAQVIKGSTAPTWKPFGAVSVSGTTETIQDELSNTATAENLLSIGDYTDTQEVLSGAVTRKVGIVALTGTESWSGNESNHYFSLAKSAITPTPTSLSYAPLCTHLVGSSSYTDTAGVIYLGTSYLNINFDNVGGGSSSQGRADFNAWLRENYGNGTPVIVVYPLATETTETVTGQTLNTQSGTNVISITQASLNDLELSATYKRSK